MSLQDLVDKYLLTTETGQGFSAVELDASLLGRFWVRVGATLVASVVATISLGLQRITTALTGLYSAILSGVTNFLAGQPLEVPIWRATDADIVKSQGLYRLLASEFERFLAALWSPAPAWVPDFLQLPFSVVLLLAAFWIVSQGIEYVREEVV